VNRGDTGIFLTAVPVEIGVHAERPFCFVRAAIRNLNAVAAIKPTDLSD